MSFKTQKIKAIASCRDVEPQEPMSIEWVEDIGSFLNLVNGEYQDFIVCLGQLGFIRFALKKEEEKYLIFMHYDGSRYSVNEDDLLNSELFCISDAIVLKAFGRVL